MNDAGFLQAIAADPGDDVARLAYADWLEERGDPRAAWVRDLAVWRWMGPRAEDPVPALLAASTEADHWQLEEITAVLRRVGPAAVPALIEVLRGADDNAIWASSALRGFDPEHLAPALPLIRQLAAEGNVSAVKLLAGLASEVRAIAPTLFERLGHSREAVWVLAATGPEAAPLLLAEAPRLDPASLAYASDRLLGYGECVAPLLLEALSDDDPRRRLLAAVALVPNDPHAAAPHLVEALETESLAQDVEECRVLDCVRALGQAAAPFAPRLRRLLWGAGDRKLTLLEILDAVDDPATLRAELFARLRSEDWQERAETITSFALVNALAADALDAAVGLLCDGDERVRGRALAAIAHLGPYAHYYGDVQGREFDAIAYLGPRGHADAIAAVRRLFRGDGPRPEAIRAMAALGAPNLVSDLLPLCEHEDEELRRTALGTLPFADGPDAEVAAALCRALDREPDGHYAVDDLCERPAALALAAGQIVARVRGDRPTRYHLMMVRRLDRHLSGDEQSALLCRHLGGDLAAVALDELSNVINGRPPVEAMPALLRLLDEGGEHAMKAAAELAWIGEPAAPELALRLKGEKRTRRAAAWALGLMRAGAAGACEALVEALRWGDSQTRSSAAEALGNVGAAARGAVGELRRQTRGTSPQLRSAAAEALGKLGATEALPDLRALLSDPCSHVRNLAAKAIDALTRQPTKDVKEAEIPF